MKRFAIAVAMLSGCASDPYWVKIAPPTAADEPIYNSAPCGYKSWNGCSVIYYSSSESIQRCRIEINVAANESAVLAHERNHCAGFDHPKYPYRLGGK